MERHGVHLQPRPDEDDGEAQRPQLPRYQRVQLVPDIPRCAAQPPAQPAGVTIHINILDTPLLHPTVIVCNHGIRYASLEGPVLLETVQVVNTVDEGGIPVAGGALCPAELAHVVGDILQSNAHHQHPQQRRQGDVHPQHLGEQDPGQLDPLTPDKREDDEDQQGEDGAAGRGDGPEDGPGREEHGGGGEEEREGVRAAAAGRTAAAGRGRGGGGGVVHRQRGGRGQQLICPGVQTQVGPAI